MHRDHRPARGCPGYREARRAGRRAFLEAGALAALGLPLPEYLRLRAAAGGPRAPARSVVLVYAMGGISHHDSFDPKPGAPAEVRGEFRTIPTALPGVRFCEHLPLLARATDRFALVRSVRHGETDHGVGAYYMLRGYTQPDPSLDRPENQNRANPTVGALVGRLLGRRGGLPPYLVVPGLSYLAQINYYTAGWMGRAFDPFVLRSDPSLPGFEAPGLARAAGVAPERTRRRSALAGALDLGAEPDRLRDAYGRTRLGQGCLLARRLVEAGARFVTVDDDGWDHHAQVFPGLRRRLPELDRCLSALLADLGARGLLDTTLVLLLTDFGRTPRVNAGAGRDHWPGVFSVLLAGGGVRGGQVVGASDRSGAAPSRRPVGPKDLAATVYHLLGIDPSQDYRSREGRPFKVLDGGEVVRELVA
jgi:hypothetical protein